LAKRSRSVDNRSRIGLALAGGGPQGAIWEIGALRAVEEAVEGVDLNQMHVYVGVSAGAFLGANLANDLSTAQMCRAIIKREPGEHPFNSEQFFRPRFRELGKRLTLLPKLLGQAIADFSRDPIDKSLLDSLTRLSRALPVAFFDNEPMRDYLHRIYSMKGRTDDFRKLNKHLIIVAADLDSARAVRFGEDGFADVPISTAVQASSAIPGLYPPVEIGGRHYVDGALLKTMHASVALEAGADLILCFNPLVPVDTAQAVAQGVMRSDKLMDRGLITVLAQALRTLIRSRMKAAMAAYDKGFPNADVVLFEPSRDDYAMFFTNVFSFTGRRKTCEHAYQSVRRNLLDRYDTLAPIFARHGAVLRRDVLADTRLGLWSGVGLPDEDPRWRPTTELGLAANDLDGLLSRLEAFVDSEVS
jgi:predicted acylesterase/phospholipase RssA